MSMIRITDADEIKPIHVVMLALVILALAGNCLLTSAGKPNILPDGARDWRPDSVLLALVEVLDLEYSQPTPNGIAIKSLVAGTAASVGILIAGIGLAIRARPGEDRDATDIVIDLDEVASGQADGSRSAKKHVDTTLAAQALMIAYVGWSFASMLWSHVPTFAFGGSVLLAGMVVWAIALSYGLNRRAARHAATILVAVLFVTACLAILYRGERNPTLRASYPIGNPLFLAACLLPGMLIAVATVFCGFRDLATKRVPVGVVRIVLCAAALVVLGYASYLTGSRGPAVGLGVGIAALMFFGGNRKIKTIVGVLAVVGIVAAGVFLYNQRSATSPTGRSASMRVRLYTWSYAVDLIQERPLAGHGQGGYALLADALAEADVESDPEPLSARIAHAHSEWLEVGADLGSVGMVLALSAVVLTLLGGAQSLERLSSPSARWTMIGLLASLAGLVVSECFGVGLRIVSLPLVFYTVIGLIWSLSRPASPAFIGSINRRPIGRVVVVVASVSVSLALAEFSRRDFAAARAQYDVASALGANDWQRATDLAEKAAVDRLSPGRKLTALRALAATRLRAAEFLFARHLSRLKASSDPAGPRSNLTALASADRVLCLQSIDGGIDALTRLELASNGHFNKGWIVFGFEQLLAGLAELDEAFESAAAHRRSAADALARQLLRQPYEPMLAASLVAASDRLDVRAIIELLARPLRLHRVPAAYLELLAELCADRGFLTQASEVFRTVQEDARLPDNEAWADRWAPETLRVGAVAAFARGEHEEAAAYLRSATALYDKLEPRPLLATMSCHAELADTCFFAYPDDARLAIESAETALEFMPRSESGRAMRDALRHRLVVYHLAASHIDAGHERFARQQIRDTSRARIDDAELDMIVAQRYVDLAFGLADHTAGELPRSWIARALELNPDHGPAWLFAAEWAVRQLDDTGAVRCINEAIRSGGPSEDVMNILKHALQAMPTSDAILQLRDQIEATLPPTDTH